MAEYALGRLWRVIVPFTVGYGALAALVVWKGVLVALWALLTAPVVLLVVLVLAKRRWAAATRDHLPEYLVSRTIHGLVNEWNQVEVLLREVGTRWTWTSPDAAQLVPIAAQLEPFVGRVRSTGYWEVRGRRFQSLPVQRLQETARQSRALLLKLRETLGQELLRRGAEHAALLSELRTRRLCDLSPGSVASPRNWAEVQVALEQIQNEQRIGVEVALRTLAAANLPQGGPVDLIRSEAEAAASAQDLPRALQGLLRIAPPAKPRASKAAGGA